MSELQKTIISFILFILWSVGCFVSGYLLCNKRATDKLNNANRELAEQQQRYDDLIRETDERIRNIRNELCAKVSNNGQTITELSGIIDQIRKQKLNI